MVREYRVQSTEEHCVRKITTGRRELSRQKKTIRTNWMGAVVLDRAHVHVCVHGHRLGGAGRNGRGRGRETGRARRRALAFTSRLATNSQTSTATTRRVATAAFLDQAWGVSLDQKTLTETLPQQLFAFSIVPYAGFLYHLTKSKQAPKLTLFGFYFLLVFVFATIPAGIYAKKVYHTTLANVDYLHGSAEFMLTLTNLFIVIGLKGAIDEAAEKRGVREEDGEGKRRSARGSAR